MKISKEIKVGLLASTALLIVYLGSNFLKGRELFSSNNIYYTTYAVSGGLSTSSPVLVNGMPVGRVRSIQILPDQGHSALVTFAMVKDITLTDATKARLVSRGLLGEPAIDLLIEAGNPLKNYDTIPGQVKQSLSEAFVETALPTLNDARDISLLTSQFVASLAENTDKINSIFTNLEATMQKLRETVNFNQYGINRVSQNLTELSNVLADSKNGIRPLLTKFNQLIEGLEGQEAKVAATELNNILGSLAKVLDKIEKGENSLSRLLHDNSFYNNLNQTLVNLDQLLIDLKAHPERYLNFSIFGKSQGREEIKKK